MLPEVSHLNKTMPTEHPRKRVTFHTNKLLVGSLYSFMACHLTLSSADAFSGSSGSAALALFWFQLSSMVNCVPRQFLSLLASIPTTLLGQRHTQEHHRHHHPVTVTVTVTSGSLRSELCCCKPSSWQPQRENKVGGMGTPRFGSSSYKSSVQCRAGSNQANETNHVFHWCGLRLMIDSCRWEAFSLDWTSSPCASMPNFVVSSSKWFGSNGHHR